MPTITFDPSNVSINVDEGTPLVELETIENNEIPFGCRAASCGTCTIKVHTGAENLSHITQEETELLDDLDLDKKTHRLACQCTVMGDIKISPIN